jgi:cytochrome c-type biogenesis protein
VTTAGAPVRRPGRAWLAAGISATVLALAIAAGVRPNAATWGPLIVVEDLSAFVSGMFLKIGTWAPAGYAVIIGMVAAVNPCGFVLLPAYVGYYLGDARSGGSGRGLAIRALTVSATMTASFAALFGLAGVLAGLAASAFTSSLPWIGTVVGASLILLGGLLASGRDLRSRLGPLAAARLGGATRTRGLRGYAAYGVAYALASLGCTLPLFLSVVGTSLQAHGLIAAVGQFVLFGVGMGVVLTAATFATAWIGDGLVRRARVLGQHIGWISAVVLWLAGAYVVYYWLSAFTLL